MKPIEELKVRLAVLEKQAAEERARDEKREKEINSNPEMVKAINDRNINKEKIKELRKKSEELEKKIKDQFLIGQYPSDIDAYSSPQFQHKTSDWSQTTNIRDTVLFHIDCHSPLYLLTNDDVKEAVKRLINKAIDQCPELVKLKNELTTLTQLESTLYNKEREVDKKLRAQFASESKVRGLQYEIDQIKFKIVHPKKAAEQEKRDSKRNDARSNLYNSTVIDEIYGKLKIKIPMNKEWNRKKI